MSQPSLSWEALPFVFVSTIFGTLFIIGMQTVRKEFKYDCFALNIFRIGASYFLGAGLGALIASMFLVSIEPSSTLFAILGAGLIIGVWLSGVLYRWRWHKPICRLNGVKEVRSFGVLRKILHFIVLLVIMFFVLYMAQIWIGYSVKNPEKLYQAIDSADQVVVTHHNNDTKVLYTSSKADDIKAFKRALHIKNELNFNGYAACTGKVGINFYKNGQRISRVAYLSNGYIRDDVIREVGYIKMENPEKIEQWLEERNISIEDVSRH